MSASRPRSEFELDRGLAGRVLLRDGRRMPVLGLGVWQTPPGKVTREAVRHAIDAGYRLVDTAAMYRNEEDVGEAVRASGVPRDELFVTTKVWNDDQGYEATRKAYERSERTLGLGPIDLYLLHWPVPQLRTESWRALSELQREGRCRSIGVSNFTIAHLEELAARFDTVPAVNQVEFSPFLFQRDLWEYCRGRGIQLEAYAPLTRGRRLGDPTLVRMGAAHGKSPAQVLIRWGLQHQIVEIPKSVRPARIVENAAVFDFALSTDEMSALDALDEGFRTSWNPSTMT